MLKKLHYFVCSLYHLQWKKQILVIVIKVLDNWNKFNRNYLNSWKHFLQTTTTQFNLFFSPNCSSRLKVYNDTRSYSLLKGVNWKCYIIFCYVLWVKFGESMVKHYVKRVSIKFTSQRLVNWLFGIRHLITALHSTHKMIKKLF